MSTFTCDCLGLDEMLKNIDLIGDKLATRAVKEASWEAAQPMANAIRGECPVDTGALQYSVEVQKKQQKRKGIAGAEIKCGKGTKQFNEDAWYGAQVEFGNKDREPDPFYERGFEQEKENTFKLMAEAIPRKLEEYVAKEEAKILRGS